jgi:hypothetical protein
MQKRTWKVGVAGVAMILSACGGGASPSASSPVASQPAASQPATSASAAAPSASAPASVGEGEGELNLIAWAGYVVGGTGG